MSHRFSRLSSDLLWHADCLEQDLLDGRSAEERKEWATHQRLVDGIVTALIASRETMLPGDFAIFERLARENRDLTDSLLDSHYTMAGLNNVGSLIDRTMRLSQLRAAHTPSWQTNRYIQEASRAYILGLPMASVAMSRAALEQGLKDRLGRQGEGAHLTFQDLIAEARRCNILGKSGAVAARDLAKACNELLHEKPIQSDAEALEVLGAIRSLLEEIYSAEGGF